MILELELTDLWLLLDSGDESMAHGSETPREQALEAIDDSDEDCIIIWAYLI